MRQSLLTPSSVLNTSWSYICTGRTDEIDIDFILWQRFHSKQAYYLWRLVLHIELSCSILVVFLLQKWTSLFYLVMWTCRALETAELCHLHCTPLSDMTNSARGQKTKCVIKYVIRPQTIPPLHTHHFCAAHMQRAVEALGSYLNTVSLCLVIFEMCSCSSILQV